MNEDIEAINEISDEDAKVIAKNERIRTEAHRQAEQAHHAWVQKGMDIICRSCPSVHASSIPHDMELIGVENGKPILRKVQYTS